MTLMKYYEQRRQDYEAEAQEEIPLGRKDTSCSLASDIMSQEQKVKVTTGEEVEVGEWESMVEGE